MDDVDAPGVPPDLEAAFRDAPRARAAYLALPVSAKHQVLWSLLGQTARNSGEQSRQGNRDARGWRPFGQSGVVTADGRVD